MWILINCIFCIYRTFPLLGCLVRLEKSADLVPNYWLPKKRDKNELTRMIVNGNEWVNSMWLSITFEMFCPNMEMKGNCPNTKLFTWPKIIFDPSTNFYAKPTVLGHHRLIISNTHHEILLHKIFRSPKPGKKEEKKTRLNMWYFSAVYSLYIFYYQSSQSVDFFVTICTKGSYLILFFKQRFFFRICVLLRIHYIFFLWSTKYDIKVEEDKENIWQQLNFSSCIFDSLVPNTCSGSWHPRWGICSHRSSLHQEWCAEGQIWWYVFCPKSR